MWKSESFSESVRLVNLSEESNDWFFLVSARKCFQNPLRCILHLICIINKANCTHQGYCHLDIFRTQCLGYLYFFQEHSNVWSTAHTEVHCKHAGFCFFFSLTQAKSAWTLSPSRETLECADLWLNFAAKCNRLTVVTACSLYKRQYLVWL